MATKDELIHGVELLIREGGRLATDIRPEQWENIVDLDGWKSKEVLAHVASVGGLVQPMVSGMATAAPGADAMAALNLDQLNAAMVGQRDALRGHADIVLDDRPRPDVLRPLSP